MPSIAWLVTTTSASRDAAFAFSGKHSASIGHLPPRHSSEVTDTCRQARSVTPGTRSSRSPVSVSSAHSRSRRTCSPRLSDRADAPVRAGAGCSAAPAWSPRSNSVPVSSSG